MTTLREMAEKVLATAHLNRCVRGYNENEGEYAEGSCKAGATHRITSPHEDRRWDYCEACAKEVHAGIEYNHRWPLDAIDGVQGLLAAQELARAVLAAETVQYFARDMVYHHLIHHPLPWRDVHDWTHEVTAADGTVIVKCMTGEQAATVIAMAEQLQAELEAPIPTIGEDGCEDTAAPATAAPPDASPSEVARVVREACVDALTHEDIRDGMSLSNARWAIRHLDLDAILAGMASESSRDGVSGQ